MGALSRERAHVERFTKSFQGLTESYDEEALRFCPCSSKTDPGGNVCAVFPFLSGESLQEILKRAVQAQDENRVDRLLREYVRRIGTEGGERPFVVTDGLKKYSERFQVEACRRAAEAYRYRRVSVILI